MKIEVGGEERDRRKKIIVIVDFDSREAFSTLTSFVEVKMDLGRIEEKMRAKLCLVVRQTTSEGLVGGGSGGPPRGGGRGGNGRGIDFHLLEGSQDLSCKLLLSKNEVYIDEKKGREGNDSFIDRIRVGSKIFKDSSTLGVFFEVKKNKGLIVVDYRPVKYCCCAVGGGRGGRRRSRRGGGRCCGSGRFFGFILFVFVLVFVDDLSTIVLAIREGRQFFEKPRCVSLVSFVELTKSFVVLNSNIFVDRGLEGSQECHTFVILALQEQVVRGTRFFLLLFFHFWNLLQNKYQYKQERGVGVLKFSQQTTKPTK